jgi:hypothetical protein
MKSKLFIATYFDNLKDALKLADSKKDKKRRKFEVIKNKQGYFVISKSVLEKVFNLNNP